METYTSVPTVDWHPCEGVSSRQQPHSLTSIIKLQETSLPRLLLRFWFLGMDFPSITKTPLKIPVRALNASLRYSHFSACNVVSWPTMQTLQQHQDAHPNVLLKAQFFCTAIPLILTIKGHFSYTNFLPLSHWDSSLLFSWQLTFELLFFLILSHPFHLCCLFYKIFISCNVFIPQIHVSISISS